jgi:hypothetical protein
MLVRQTLESRSVRLGLVCVVLVGAAGVASAQTRSGNVVRSFEGFGADHWATKGSTIGIEVDDVADNDATEGAFVHAVCDGSPAASAGFAEGDVVAEFDGESSAVEIPYIVANKHISCGGLLTPPRLFPHKFSAWSCSRPPIRRTSTTLSNFAWSGSQPVKAATSRQHDETVPVQTYRFEVTDAGPRFVCPGRVSRAAAPLGPEHREHLIPDANPTWSEAGWRTLWRCASGRRPERTGRQQLAVQLCETATNPLPGQQRQLIFRR